ncbi:MAG: hypothetical protein ACI31G_05170 [Bacilli bacterium]
MRKKLLSFFSFIFLSFSLCSCKSVSHVTFAKDEYEVRSGDTVKVEHHVSGVTYSFINNDISGLSVNPKTGLITFDDNVINYSQVLYQATYKNETSVPVVLTLVHDYETPELLLINPTSFVSDGDYVVVSNSLGLSNTFALKNKINGVTIDVSSGRLNIDDFVENNTRISVVISSNGAILEHDFFVSKTSIATSSTKTQSFEKSSNNPVSYYLDFSNVDLETYPEEVLMVFNKNNIIDSSTYSYDNEYHKLTFTSEAFSILTSGENELTIVTNRNNIKVKIVVADKFIKTVDDLLYISTNQETLRGYYILINDIDLTSYLSTTGEGYNEGKGWNPIGVYHDVADGTSLNDVFNGTFDGDGYTIKGLYINRGDDFAYNAGLFGYIGSLGVIKNLNVETSEKTNQVKSYSGVIAGFNSGTISNCTAKGNISNYTGEGVYKYLGGIVGRNAGEIDSCISYVSVLGDNSFGLICGFNEGSIQRVYSYKNAENIELIGSGLPAYNSILFDSLSSLLNYSFSDFDNNFWNINLGSYPSLIHQFEYYFIDQINITNKVFDYVVGDVIEVIYIISPQSLMEKYKDNVRLEVNDSSLVVDGLKIDTSSFLGNSFIATIKLELDNEIYSSSKTFDVYPVPSKISLNTSSLTSLIPGEQYILSSTIEADNSYNYSVSYFTVPSSIKGVTITNNVLSINENITSSINFSIYAKVGSVSSSSCDFVINPLIAVDNNIYVKYQNEENNFDIDVSDIGQVEVAIFDHQNKQFTISNNVLSISLSSLENDQFKTLKLVKDNIGYVYYLGKNSENKFNVDDLDEYIAINSKEDFDTYFNILTYNDNKFANYSKTFVLTNDIDFENQTIYGIGTESNPFNGKFYGNGHTIKNLKITDNELYLTLSSTQKNNTYRQSKYGVGLFSYLSGEVKDLIIDNIEVIANNYVGGFSGVINETAIVRNVHLYHLTVMNINEVSYPASSEDKVHYFAAVNLGNAVLVSANNGLENLY